MADPAPADREVTIGALVSEVASDVTRLLGQEVELAKSEIRAEAAKAGQAARMMVSGAVAMILVAVLASIAAVFAASVVLAERVPAVAGQAQAVAAGGVAVLWLILGTVFLSIARRRLRKISPIPRRTIQTLKEDIAWLRKPTA